MHEAERIMRFTHGVAMMKDPPFLPMAAWFAVVPVLRTFGMIATFWAAISFILAVVVTALASRRFKRTYGVVTASRDAYSRLAGRGIGLLILVVVVSLQIWSVLMRLPVQLGLAALGAWFAIGARASKGIRPHLYILAAICVGLAFVPLIADITGRPSLLTSTRGGGNIYVSAFGVGWVYVCVQDYRMIRRNLRLAQG
jgi:hypothetical protein